MAHDQFSGDLVLPALRIRGTTKLMKRVGGHLSKQVAMDVHGSNGRVTVFREPCAVKAGDRNIFGNSVAHRGETLHHTDGGEIVDGHHRGWDRRHPSDGQTRGKPALKAQIPVQDRPGFESEGPHSSFVRFQAGDVGFEFGSAGDEGDFTVSLLMQVFNNLLNSGRVINSESADVSASRGEIKKSDGDSSVRQFIDQARANFGSHDGDTADTVRHHAAGSLLRAARIVVRVAEDGFVAELPGARQKTFNDLRKKRIFDVGDNYSQRARVARSEAASMYVGEITQAFYRGKNQALSPEADLASFIQNIGDRRGGYACSFCHISYR